MKVLGILPSAGANALGPGTLVSVAALWRAPLKPFAGRTLDRAGGPVQRKITGEHQFAATDGRFTERARIGIDAFAGL